MTVEVQKDFLREKTLETAKRHKASWIELGQYLFTIHKDKMYKEWGYLAFETYCRKELSIKETTASKLLKSYSFLEKEEPQLASPERFLEEDGPKAVPHYESVNLLRLAKENKELTPHDFADIRKSVIQDAREPKEVRAQVKQLLSGHEVKDANEERKSRRNTAIKRLVTVLAITQKQLESEGLLPGYLIKQMRDLTEKLQDQIEA